MEQSELIGLVCLRPQNFAWFLGAGASRSAGLPTATDLLWDMKRRYYCSEENQDISRQEMQVEAIQDKIQKYIESQGFPPLWDDAEYTSCFVRIFGDDKERQRKYIKAMLSEEHVSLSVGHRVLGAMLASGLTRAVFTTNFDTVIEKAVAEVAGTSLGAYHIEGASSANEALNNEEFPIYCKLHGDFRYDSIKNLPEELATQNTHLAQCMINAANRFGFIVSGYSGRDESIMELFRSALAASNPFPHGLFWTGMSGKPIQVVSDLLDAAKAKGIRAEYVQIETFDSLLSRTWRNIEGRLKALDGKVRKTETSRVAIPLPKNGSHNPLLRLNALPIHNLPSQCLQLNFKASVEWSELRKAQHETEGRLVLTKAENVWCWGEQRTARDHFGTALASIDTADLPEDLSRPESLHLRGFLEDALAKAIARSRPLLARTTRTGTWLIVDRHSEDPTTLSSLQQVVGKVSGKIPGLFTEADENFPRQEQIEWAEAARVSLDVKQDQAWLLVDPDIWIWPPRGRRIATDFLDRRRGNRFNDTFNALLNAWVNLLLGPHERNSDIPISPFDNGSEVENPRFTLGSRTAYSRRAR